MYSIAASSCASRPANKSESPPVLPGKSKMIPLVFLNDYIAVWTRGFRHDQKFVK